MRRWFGRRSRGGEGRSSSRRGGGSVREVSGRFGGVGTLELIIGVLAVLIVLIFLVRLID